MMFDYLWVVEMLNNGRWEATVGCGISRESARRELAEWKHNNPCDKFRIRKYKRAAE